MPHLVDVVCSRTPPISVVPSSRAALTLAVSSTAAPRTHLRCSQQAPIDVRAPSLQQRPAAYLVKLYRAGEHTVSELEELFPVTRSTIYRAIERAGARAPASSAEPIRAGSGRFGVASVA